MIYYLIITLLSCVYNSNHIDSTIIPSEQQNTSLPSIRNNIFIKNDQKITNSDIIHPGTVKKLVERHSSFILSNKSSINEGKQVNSLKVKSVDDQSSESSFVNELENESMTNKLPLLETDIDDYLINHENSVKNETSETTEEENKINEELCCTEKEIFPLINEFNSEEEKITEPKEDSIIINNDLFIKEESSDSIQNISSEEIDNTIDNEESSETTVVSIKEEIIDKTDEELSFISAEENERNNSEIINPNKKEQTAVDVISTLKRHCEQMDDVLKNEKPSCKKSEAKSINDESKEEIHLEMKVKKKKNILQRFFSFFRRKSKKKINK